MALEKLNIIHFSVKRGVMSRDDDANHEHSDQEFRELRESVLKRDDYSCFFCRFRSEKFQEVHHKNDNHADNSEKNLVTVCPICHACKHIGKSGADKKGYIIYYPGINQVELNLLIKYLWVGEKGQDVEIRDACKSIIQSLERSRNVARDLITDDPAVLGGVLIGMGEKEYNERQEKLKGFLFLPSSTHFANAIKYWGDDVMKNVTPDTWKNIAGSG